MWHDTELGAVAGHPTRGDRLAMQNKSLMQVVVHSHFNYVYRFLLTIQRFITNACNVKLKLLVPVHSTHTHKNTRTGVQI